jgi:hypothetical protein
MMSGVLVPFDLGVSQGLPALLPRTRWLLYSLVADAGLQQQQQGCAASRHIPRIERLGLSQ